MAKLNNNEINDALDEEYGIEKVSNMRASHNDEDVSGDKNREVNTVYSFEIEEDFTTLSNNLQKSMKNGIVRALAHDEREIFTDRYIENIPVYDENLNRVGVKNAQVLSCGYEENDGSITLGCRRGIEIGKDDIVLIETNEDRWDFSRDIVKIIPSEKGGCIVQGDIHLLTDSERSIFTGVRKEMTYIPDSLISYKQEHGYLYQKTYIADEVLRNQENNKITLQSLKNDFGNESFGKASEDIKVRKRDQINAILNYIDPDKDKPLEVPHTGVIFHHHIHNYGTGIESEYIDIQNDYPADCLYGRYEHNGTMSDWGCRADVPSHWNEKQIQQFLELRHIDHYDISEKLFDRYLKSGQKSLVKYLKEVHNEAIETHKNIEKAVQRVKDHIEYAKESTPVRNVSADAPFKVTPAKRGKGGMVE